MKTFLYIFISSCVLFTFRSCDTKQEWWNSGISSPYHDCSIMEFLRRDSYNWELTVELIERAQLTNLFEGQVDSLKEITFLAPPSYSILRHLYDNNLEKVSELSQDECCQLVLKHVIKGKHLKEEIIFRNPDYLILDTRQDGFSEFTCVGGNKIRVWKDKSAWAGVPDVGPETMYIYSFNAQQNVPLATPNIQPLNGVVHALNYNYVLGKI